MDQPTIDRIQLMHPKLREELLAEYKEINNILPKGVRLRFVQTLRTFEEQRALFLKRPKVTNAKEGQSYHNYGIAFDICILFDTNNDGKFETVSWNIDKHWMRVVEYFKSKGWEWGGDWKKFKDAPHFEKRFGYNWRQLLEKYNKNEFIEGTKYVKI